MLSDPISDYLTRIRNALAVQPRVLGGMGTAIVSTSRGVMSGHEASHEGVGGEVVAYVW